MIRSLLTKDNYVIAVEHDISILDYLADSICVTYGIPGAYGVVSKTYSVKEGINIFLKGEIPEEKIRFREDEITFSNVDKETIKKG
jgi:ATP-binding cassette, sub-family E, member 1